MLLVVLNYQEHRHSRAAANQPVGKGIIIDWLLPIVYHLWKVHEPWYYHILLSTNHGLRSMVNLVLYAWLRTQMSIWLTWSRNQAPLEVYPVMVSLTIDLSHDCYRWFDHKKTINCLSHSLMWSVWATCLTRMNLKRCSIIIIITNHYH